MRYPIAIEPGTDATAWGVVVPDLPGCFSAGDTMADAMIQAEEAVTGWIEAARDAGQDIPKPSSIDARRAANTDFAGWLWALVKIEPAARAWAKTTALARLFNPSHPGLTLRDGVLPHWRW